ncbi:MAG: HAD family hydrolase [Pirellulaceae bacterium]|nr:HAD family hydrolase [Pirellulaceae bacterium]
MPTAAEIFQRLAQPLEPIPTSETPSLKTIEGIRVVLFDLYGTLLISGSGEVGTEAAPSDVAVAEAFQETGLETTATPEEILACLDDAIRTTHARLREMGRDWPEVDIREVWGNVLTTLVERGRMESPPPETFDIAQLAAEYEARANPVALMPGARECLAALREHGCLLGIVSNAQFYTHGLLEALFGGLPESVGFEPALQYYSYQYGWGKPSQRLFEMAASELAERAIEPPRVLYVGNDMRNDVLGARNAGFHTALFAGDARSLRRREDDSQMIGVVPDLVLTELSQLPGCIIEKTAGET